MELSSLEVKTNFFEKKVTEYYLHLDNDPAIRFDEDF
jgi:hypothetical protein